MAAPAGDVDKSTADLKIVTKDGKELWAHKVILKGNILTAI